MWIFEGPGAVEAMDFDRRFVGPKEFGDDARGRGNEARSVRASAPLDLDGGAASATGEGFGFVDSDLHLLDRWVEREEHRGTLFDGDLEESVFAEAEQRGDRVGDAGVVGAVLDATAASGAGEIEAEREVEADGLLSVSLVGAEADDAAEFEAVDPDEIHGLG